MGKIYQLIVIGFKGDKQTIDVGHSEEEFNNCTVLQFKKKIVEKNPGLHATDPSALRLLYTDKQLEDSDQFSDHQITDRSSIYMIIKLPGGLWN